MKQIEDRAQLKQNHQNNIAMLISKLSPVTSFNNMVTNLAETGEYDRKKFILSATAYHESLERSLFGHINRDISPSGSLSMSIDDNIDLENFPAFTVPKTSLKETISAVGIDIGILLLFLIVSFALSYVSFLKYDVR